jgi:hypothetical protein
LLEDIGRAAVSSIPLDELEAMMGDLFETS